MDASKMRKTNFNPKQSTPSFFKILLDNTTPNLPLPPAFVKNQILEERISENPKLKTEYGERSWSVKIEKNGGKYCFGDGWLDFVKDTKSEVGDFLVFWLIGKSTFKVSIFGPNACEKNLSSAIPTPCKCICDCGRSGNSDADLKNVIEIEEEDDYDDENKDKEDDDDENNGEDEEIDDDDDKDDGEEEESDDDDEIEVKDEEFMNPCFEKVLMKSHYYTMTLPSRFVNETGIDKQGKILVRIKEEKKEWSVKIGRHLDRVYLGIGWLDFWRDNKLNEGDTCSFKYFNREGSRTKVIEFEFVKKVPRKRGRPCKYFHGEGSRSNLSESEIAKKVPRKRGRTGLRQRH